MTIGLPSFLCLIEKVSPTVSFKVEAVGEKDLSSYIKSSLRQIKSLMPTKRS